MSISTGSCAAGAWGNPRAKYDMPVGPFFRISIVDHPAIDKCCGSTKVTKHEDCWSMCEIDHSKYEWRDSKYEGASRTEIGQLGSNVANPFVECLKKEGLPTPFRVDPNGLYEYYHATLSKRQDNTTINTPAPPSPPSSEPEPSDKPKSAAGKTTTSLGSLVVAVGLLTLLL